MGEEGDGKVKQKAEARLKENLPEDHQRLGRLCQEERPSL
jgi:hypothetical protein